VRLFTMRCVRVALTLLLIEDRLLQGVGEHQPMLAIRELQAPILNTTPIANNVLPGNTTATHTQSAPTTTSHRTKYRPLPTKTKPPTGAKGTKKRKQASKDTRPIQYFEDSESENDSGKQSGDGTSSGDSIRPEAVSAKRQKISRVATRSSTRGVVPGATVGSPDSASLPPATTINANDTVGSDGVIGTGTDDVTRTDTDNVVRTDTDDVRTDIDDVCTDTDDVVRTDANNLVSAGTDDDDGTNTKVITATGSRASSPMSLDEIDVAAIPAFLLQHGTGARQVNIFNYLKSFEDPHFQPVLLYYLRLQINNQSGSKASLSTTKRPIQIGLWIGRARPACLPDYLHGGQTFAAFVDSIFGWWGYIQPSWRVFERGKVTREVGGGWDGLYAPSINGLLNVVVLVYWWARILKEDEPEDGVRADYEFFANDVAWVLSHLLLK
jgi:hypothetical protein